MITTDYSSLDIKSFQPKLIRYFSKDNLLSLQFHSIFLPNIIKRKRNPRPIFYIIRTGQQLGQTLFLSSDSFCRWRFHILDCPREYPCVILGNTRESINYREIRFCYLRSFRINVHL